MRVLVLDGDQNQAVACVRSLGRAGHTVIVGDAYAWPKAGCSRFCRGTFIYPLHDAAKFVASVVAELKRQPGTLVLPLTERTSFLVSAHRDSLLQAGARLVLPAHADLQRAFNKRSTADLAEQLGMNVPRTAVISTPAQLPDAIDSLRLPVVVKPSTSSEVSSKGIRITGGPQYARTRDQFRAAYRDVAQRCSTVLVQEFVEGYGAGYFALLNHGELRAEFAHRRLRDLRPSGSGSVLRVSVEPDPALRSASLRLLRELHWHGPAMVEYRVREDGIPVFLEVNGRFWHSLALACYAGVDFPARLAEMAEFGDIPQQGGFKTGLRCRWLLGDFRHLLEVWRGAPPGFPGRFPARLSTLWAFLMPVRGTMHDNFQWSDPLPEFADWINFGRQLVRRVLEREQVHAEGCYSHP